MAVSRSWLLGRIAVAVCIPTTYHLPVTFSFPLRAPGHVVKAARPTDEKNRDRGCSKSFF